MIKREFSPSESNSFFLFGPRGSGKTTFLDDYFTSSETLYVDLLDIEIYDQLLLDPARFEALINKSEHSHKRVVIDEVQRLPRLLDIVQQQIQSKKRQFVLTGSSRRRLKQSGTNLLAGRAWVYHLYPFSTFELKDKFDLKKALEWGGLPDAYLAPDELSAREYLNAYVGTYLQKEIQEEQWVRKLAPFRKFLSIASQMNGKIINKAKMARDIGVNDITIAHYFEILEDTLIGLMLPCFHRSVRKGQRAASKFYFIDPGIKRALDRTLTVPLLPQTAAWGEAFEHWVILETVKNISYLRLDWTISYFKTKHDVEIDLIIERPNLPIILIEIKSKVRVDKTDVKSLESIGPDIDPHAVKLLLSNDPLEQILGTCQAIYWQEGIRRIFSLAI